MKLPTSLVFLAGLVSNNSACSVTEDFEFATQEEQFNKAMVVATGTVVEAVDMFDSEIDTGYIVLDVDKYYCSCGPARIRVSGFTHSAACGVGVPRVQSSIGVFGCVVEEGEVAGNTTIDLEINAYTVHTGVAVGEELEPFCSEIKSPEECEVEQGQFVLNRDECGKADNNGVSVTSPGVACGLGVALMSMFML